MPCAIWLKYEIYSSTKSQNHKTKMIDVSSSEYVYLFGGNIFLFFMIAIDL